MRFPSGSHEEQAMAHEIPESHRDIFEKKAFAHLATLMPDGSPQVTPVWCELEGGQVLVNSAKGRRKDRNMRRDARVSLSLIDPDNGYRYVEVRGRVVEITEDGAEAHIDRLAKKYLDLDEYPYRRDGEVRVIYRIESTGSSCMG
jgi:PPOX class probable F420-dependent enzyme